MSPPPLLTYERLEKIGLFKFLKGKAKTLSIVLEVMMWQTCQGSGGKGEGVEEEEEAQLSLDGDQKHAKKDGAAEKELELPK